MGLLQKKEKSQCGRDSSVVKKTCYSCRGTGLDSQHSCGNSQPNVTLVRGNPKLSADLHRYCAYNIIHIHTYRQNTHIHK